MGCDIHIMVEQQVDAKWKSVSKLAREEDDGRIWISVDDEIYDGRNYNLFAVLANVRNGYGFAGCDTGDPMVPISMPRGVPEDASEDYKELVEQWSSDGHSHSYHTLKQLLEYDWTQTATNGGYVSPKQYLRFKLDKKPESWSGDVGGGKVKKITNLQMEEHISKNGGKIDWSTYHSLNELPIESLYTQVEWQEPYHETIGNFFGMVIPKLLRVDSDYNKVRIVFFFDN